MGIRNTLVFLISTLLALTPVTIAQTVTGQLTGTVVDSAGAIVAGASVQALGASARAASNPAS